MQTDLSNFDHLMLSNLKSVMLLTKNAVPHLIKTNGRIVNVSSITPNLNSTDSLPYTLSKAGIDQFTKCIALGNFIVIL
jgi:NAD(P)-dependent dehydrogenase (short-subunit alcohol dehydrogenase family)